MKFLSLHINRFGVFQEPFTLPLAGQGLVLVEGKNWDAAGSADSNGAGKSMLFEAIPWALWGKMSRYGDRRVATELGEADVSVELEINGERFRVRRQRTEKGSAKLDVYAFANQGGGPWVKLVGPFSPVTANGDITPLLGFAYDTFRSALFLQATGLTVAQSGFTAQTSLLESVLRFDVLTAALEEARGRFKVLSGKAQNLQFSLNGARTHASHWLKHIEELEAFDEADKEEALGLEIVDLKAQIGRLSSLAEQQDTLIQAWRTAQRQWAEAKANRVTSETTMQGLQEVADEPVCSRCGQKVDAAHIEKEIEELELVLDTQRKLEQEARTAEEEARRALDRLDFNKERLAETRATLDHKRVELDDVRKRSAQRGALIAEHRVKFEAEQENVARLSGEVSEAQGETLKAEFWAKAFGSDGLKAEILASATPVLNQAALRYGELLAGGAIRVEFQTLRTTKAEDMIRVSGLSATRYEGLSSGEKRRVDLIVALALRELARWRLAQPLNVTLYDEVFDALDEHGLQRVVAVIERDMEELETTFVITHNPAMKALFPGAKVIRVEREGGKSHVQF